MYRFTCHFMLLVLWAADYSDSYESSQLGDKCFSSQSCTTYSAFVKDFDCEDGACRCRPGIEIRYTKSLKPICNGDLQAVRLLSRNCVDYTCKEDEECVDASTSLFYCKQKMCVCKDGLIRIDSKCRKVSYQKVLEPCYVPENDTVLACKTNESSICKNEKCICFESFFANKTSGKCEPKENYVNAYNLTKYKVKPLEYCYSDSDCIEGLKCKNYQCNCPVPCKYNSTAEICDCGAIETLYTVKNIDGPAIIGCLISVGIVSFWYHTIVYTCEGYKKKKNVSHNIVFTNEGPCNAGNILALKPIPSRAHTSNQFSQEEVRPRSDTPGKKSVPNENRTEENTNVRQPLSPQASLYNFNSQVSPARRLQHFFAPPPYPSVIPGPPPPYSLHPTETAPILETSTSAVLPYSATDNPVYPLEVGGATAPSLDSSSTVANSSNVCSSNSLEVVGATASSLCHSITEPNPSYVSSINPVEASGPTALIFNPTPPPYSPAISHN